jgi:hypothetical protein
VSNTIDQTGRSAARKEPAGNSSAAEQILSRSQSGRDLVQEFVPLAQSLEWFLGQEYLKERGNKAFLSDSSPVPYVVNNDGSLSRRAAQVLFESLEARGESQEKEALYVLELGIGVGLFARLFLDQFRDLCRKNGRDYYDRLCYIAADRSPRMLLDVARHGLLARHAGHYRLRVVDAMKPGEALPYDVAFRGERRETRDETRPLIRAVFLNYLLDCLPAAVLEVDSDPETGKPSAVRQLHVRTCVARNVKLADFTDMSGGSCASGRRWWPGERTRRRVRRRGGSCWRCMGCLLRSMNIGRSLECRPRTTETQRHREMQNAKCRMRKEK